MKYRNMEFYNTPDGEVMIKEKNKPARVFTDSERDLIENILSLLRDRYVDAYNKLLEIYSKSERNKLYYEYRIVHRFIRCNFGEYDQFNYDINDFGNYDFEEVKCPMRGECLYEGVICKPRLTTELTNREMMVFRLIVDNMQTEEIAQELAISIPTVNRHRENIKVKIGVKSVSQMINYWHNNHMK